MSAAVLKKPYAATLEDLLALPGEGHGYEIVDGELIEKESSAEHGGSQADVAGVLRLRFGRRSGGRWPGGWWFATEVLIDFGPGHHYRPDVVGWRREKVPARPTGTITALIPEWICEIVSPSNARHDTITKKRIYHRAQVGHYWLLDPVNETLSVLRWTPQGYSEVLSAQRGETVRAEPFDAVAIPLGVFFGDDDDDE